MIKILLIVTILLLILTTGCADPVETRKIEACESGCLYGINAEQEILIKYGFINEEDDLTSYRIEADILCNLNCYYELREE